MKQYLLIISFLAVFNKIMAMDQETVQWASKVIFVSSDTSSLQYSGKQALHKPNVFPQGGKSPNAWRPKNPDKNEHIAVQFSKAIQAQQIAIAETENPGAISKIYAYDVQNNEYFLFELTPKAIPLKSRLLNLFFEKTPYKIASIRIDIAGGLVEGFNSIDAIGISDSNLPINILIELTSNVNFDVEVKRLSENVNSSYIERSPLLSSDGNTLYFSRKFHPDNIGGVDDEDIWYSKKDPNTGKWLPAKNIGPPLNTPGSNFISSITQDADGSTILLLGNQYQKKGKMIQGISMSKRNNKDSWNKPVNLVIKNYYNYSDKADYYMNPENEVILLSAERDDTYGDRDLYVIFKINKGNWSEPLNLGPNINTADIEQSPFIGTDNETIYFSSNGYRGYGNADIYVSKRLDDTWTKWSNPENMGRGQNSPLDDIYFNIPSSGNIAYFTKGNIDENTDIFQFKIDEFFLNNENIKPTEADMIIVDIIGRVLNAKTNKPIGNTKVIVERLPDGIKLGETISAEDGKYSFTLKHGARYGFLAQSNGYLSVNENIDLNDIKKSSTIMRDLFLTPIEKGATISINNIFFDFDKAVLNTASYSELKRILDLLNDNKIQTIEISGHTDSVGDDNYNLILSKRRSQSVYNFFKEKKIIESRLISKGFGEIRPLVANDTEENKAINRRVEFKIID